MAITRGRTDQFSIKNLTNTEYTCRCYLFTVSNSGLLFGQKFLSLVLERAYFGKKMFFFSAANFPSYDYEL